MNLNRVIVAALGAVTVALLSTAVPAGATSSAKPVKDNYHASMTGTTIYFSPAGMEPDFDLINRVIIVTQAHVPGKKPMTLILDMYLESFQTDTQPVLPDLIHPKVALSSTLGGFFSGKAIIVGPHNAILYVGNMLAEALIKPFCMYATSKVPPPACRNEVQHMLVTLYGQGPAKGGFINLKSAFVGNQKLQVTSGRIYGTARIPAKAQALLSRGTESLAINSTNQKVRTQAINQVLHDFQVPRPIMRGTAGSGAPTRGYCFNGHCTNQRGTSSGGGGTKAPTGTTTVQTSTRPGWMAPLGLALIALALVLLAVYFWQQRKDAAAARRRSTVDQA